MDAAIIAVFEAAGARVSDPAGFHDDHGNPGNRCVDLWAREITIRGKGDNNNRRPLIATGICQMVVRRGRQRGVEVFPHRFRHHFSHTWLDRGGAEGYLMELNGWVSPQMLRRYGASARSARARRTYDRIMDGYP
jgi:integrase